jgi:mannose-6-phosphate isomerase class I
MKLYPLKFRPILKQRLWGGRKLRDFGRDIGGDEKICESRELADLPDDKSVISKDELAGQCHFLPVGTAHSIGAGLLIDEIQTPSDTTYHVFDFYRVDNVRTDKFLLRVLKSHILAAGIILLKSQGKKAATEPAHSIKSSELKLYSFVNQ